jgi:hypothetical protein
VFKADLLAKTSSKPKHEPERNKWTEFEIYLTDDSKLVLNLINCTNEGVTNNRSFVCENFLDVQKCLAHPVYGTMSFAAQKCYRYALQGAIVNGLIDEESRELFEIDTDAHKRNHTIRADLPDLMEDDDLPDFDFSED